jgi:DNA-binding NarL/FixJ family response regulator
VRTRRAADLHAVSVDPTSGGCSPPPCCWVSASPGSTGSPDFPRQARPQRPEAQRELARLTERECEVAIEVARGSSNAEIAERLHMSVATVKANVTRIVAKLGTDNCVNVAMKVRDAGLL